MEPRPRPRRRTSPGYAGAEGGPAAVPAVPAKPKIPWKTVLLTALITGAGFYIGSRLMKAASEKATGDDEDVFEARRAMLLGQPGAHVPQPVYGQMQMQPATIAASPDGKHIMITPEALARLQAGR
jgi:hypothetical protein